MTEVIIQGVNDYRSLKERGMLKNGRPNWLVINKEKQMPRNMTHAEAEAVCEFIWDGWMARLMGVANLRVSPEPIYKHLEPKIWKSLISIHQMESETSR